jgi:protein subunit release factor B
MDASVALQQRMRRLGIREEDLEERFVRSGGPGGQNVNKVATCVILLHRPTGMQVRCERQRSQGQNRQLAREMLVERMEALRRLREQAEAARVAKARAQKRKRPRWLREQLLAFKKARSEKKTLRRRMRHED